MGSRDYLEFVAPALRPMLREGEQLLAASPLTRDQGTTEDVSVSDELKNLLDPTMLIGGAHPGNLLQRAAFGRAVIGGPDSLGRRVFEGIESAGRMAVTDVRLLFFEIDLIPRGTGLWQRWFGKSDMVGRLVHEVPRAAIVGAVAAPAGVLRRGRLLVVFRDRSSCALVCTPGLVGTMLTAIGGPRPEGSV